MRDEQQNRRMQWLTQHFWQAAQMIGNLGWLISPHMNLVPKEKCIVIQSAEYSSFRS